jgi:hypothetical protein
MHILDSLSMRNSYSLLKCSEKCSPSVSMNTDEHLGNASQSPAL